MLERIKESGDIYMAWSDEPWILDGAAVNVSFIAYDDGSEKSRQLNGVSVATINADLSAGVNLSIAKRLPENRRIAFMGDIKVGPFDIAGEVARSWLDLPNPHGRSNREVLRPWANGLDITRRPRDYWIIDFGLDMSLEEAALFEEPFRYVEANAKPFRMKVRQECCRKRWWIHHNRRPEMSKAIAGLNRYIATSRVSKHRIFAWLNGDTLPDSALVAVARDDDYTFGLLQSTVHTSWALVMGTQLESRPRYTSTSTFETFPFPRPSDEQRETITEAARELHRLREGWLNPEGALDEELERRTLTNLYNERPSWLAQAHDRLDQAVLDAYGWPADIGTDDLLARLLALNLERASGVAEMLPEYDFRGAVRGKYAARITAD